MAAEGKPHSDDSLLARPLGLAARLVMRYPIIVLGSAVLLALAAVLLTVTLLGFHSNRLDLLNPDSQFNQRWLAYLDEFGEEDDAVVVVQGPRRSQVVAALDELAAGISLDEQHFRQVMHRRDLSAIRRKALHLAPSEKLAQLERFLSRVQPITEGGWSRLDAVLQIEHMTQALDATPGASEARDAIEHDFRRLLDNLSQAFADPPTLQAPWPEFSRELDGLDQLDNEHLLSDEGRMGFVLLRVNRQQSGFSRGSDAIDRLRSLIAAARPRHPEVSIGLTGLPILENDEMRTSERDMMRSGVLSLLGVAFLFVAGFGGVRHPLMTVAALLLAMAWSFGYVTLAVGHLNILSVSFGVILIGLGIDFGIHYVARYLQVRKTAADCRKALIETSSSVGPGIVVGGLTTALAFGTAALTDFTGIAELGIIASGGILLCILAAMFVLPAMIFLADRRRQHEPSPALIPVEAIIKPVLQRPRAVLIVGLTVTVIIGGFAVWLRYDHNLLNLQPSQLESVELEREILSKSDRSVWFALSMATSREEILRRKADFEQLDCVDHTEEIASLLPPGDEGKSELVQRIADRLQSVPSRSPVIPVSSPSRFQEALARAESSLERSDAEDSGSLPQLRARLVRMSPDEISRRVSHYQQHTADELVRQLQTLRAIAEPLPPQPADIPAGLRARLIGRNGKFLLKVYPRGDIWDMDDLKQFVAAVERVDPEVTGHPVQTYYASRQMQQSYLHAAIYSLIAVCAVLMLDFRSIRHSLLALLPVGLGMLLLFGVMGIFGIPLNPANMIVLPLILGIGIDDGVHIVHDYRRQSGAYRLSSSTAAAVVLTSATTSVGFGMMMLAKHQGLQSLGQVLTIGVFCCLVTSLLMLPALLVVLTSSRSTTVTSEQSQKRRAVSAHNAEPAERPRDASLPPEIPVHATTDKTLNATTKPLDARRRSA